MMVFLACFLRTISCLFHRPRMEETIIDIAKEEWESIVSKLLIYREKDFNAMIRDTRSFSAQTVRSSAIKDIEELLKFFTASTPSKKKEELVEFLRLMPGYSTHDKNILQRRLQMLYYHLKQTGGIRDPLLYAKLQNQPEEKEDIPGLVE